MSEYRDVGRARAAVPDGPLRRGPSGSRVITVRTPDPAFDVMLNRWTLYQALGCRMWARSALYQSSGAYGFRDQLQDVMAFVYAEPAVARAHIVRAAATAVPRRRRPALVAPRERTGRPHPVLRRPRLAAVRRRPLRARHRRPVGARRSRCPFSTMRQLEPHEHEVYDLPEVSAERATVYEHCLRALRQACTTGVHGLPLIGIGDWNDGMNRVGVEGRGESVWLAWFLVADAARLFAEHAEHRGDRAVSAELRRQADDYAAAVEAAGMGRQLVPPRVLRRRDAAWHGVGQGVPHRFDRAELERHLRAPATGSASASAMRSLEERLVREDARLVDAPCPSVRHHARSIRGTSRATCRGSVRTARSTPMPRSGSSSPPRCAATATGPSSSTR